MTTMPTGLDRYRISGTICGGRDEAGPTCSNLNCAVPQAATSSSGNSRVSLAHDPICSMPVPARFDEACFITEKFTIFYSKDFIAKPFSNIPTNHRARRALFSPLRPAARLRTTVKPASGSSRQGRADHSGGDDKCVAEA